MHDASTTITDFLNAAAAKQPTPGGGAVAAVAGALAAAMGEMVLNYSVAKKDLAAYAERNQAALTKLTSIRATLLQRMADDQAAFVALTAARKAGEEPLPLVRKCIDVPMEITHLATRTLEIASDVAATSNAFLLSDLSVCGECAMAALRSGLHNVAANLADLPAGEREETSTRMHAARVEGVRLIQTLTAAIAARQATA